MKLALPLAIALGAAGAAAQVPTDPHHPGATRRPISFAEAMALADRAPSVQAARQAASAQRAAGASIPGLGNPEVVVSPGVRTTGPERGLAAEVTVVQPIPLTGVGGARRAAAEAEAKALDREANAFSLGIRLDAATGFCALWGSSRSLRDLAEEVELARELVARLEEGTAAGSHTSADVAEARLYLAEARHALVAQEGEVHDLGLELAARLELREPSALVASGELPAPALPREGALDAVLAAIDRVPEVALRSMQAAAAKARARELAAEAIPRLGVGAAYRQDGPGDRAWYAVLALELPLFERSQRDRGQAAAAARSLEGEAETAASRARALAVGFQHEVEHTAEALEVIEGEMLPPALESVRLRELELSLGEGTVVDLLRARQALARVKARLVGARADAAAAQARLALLLETSGWNEGSTR
ncbi:MAG TPA: TolC family protein [Vulgatibacter sp.]|nr:TolC family protein [Vulgatibacter sp.]